MKIYLHLFSNWLNKCIQNSIYYQFSPFYFLKPENLIKIYIPEYYLQMNFHAPTCVSIRPLGVVALKLAASMNVISALKQSLKRPCQPLQNLLLNARKRSAVRSHLDS